MTQNVPEPPSTDDVMLSPKSSKAVFATTAATATLIWLAGLFVPSHVSLEPLRWSPFPPAGDAWSFSGWPEAAIFDTGVTLRSSDTGINRLSFAVPIDRPVAERAWLQVSGRVVEEPRLGESWTTAAIGLGFVSAAGETFGYRNLHFVPRRTTSPERFSEVVEWPAGAVEARVSLHSRPGAPTFTLLEGSAEFVQPNPFYVLALVVLTAVALCWGVVLFRFAKAHEATAMLVAPGVVAIAIVVGVSLSSQALRPLTTPILAILEGGLGIDRTTAAFVLLKGGHAFAFFLLTIGLLSLRRKIRVRRTHLAVFAALLAMGSEGLQVHLSGRNGSVRDVLIDLAGVLVALIAFRLITGRSRSRKAKVRRHKDKVGLATDSPVEGTVAASAEMDAATGMSSTTIRVDALETGGEGDKVGANGVVAADAGAGKGCAVGTIGSAKASRAAGTDDAFGTDGATVVGHVPANVHEEHAHDATQAIQFQNVDDDLDATRAMPSLIVAADEPVIAAPPALLRTMALWSPDVDLGSPWESPAKQRKRKSRRRSRGLRGRLTRALSW